MRCFAKRFFFFLCPHAMTCLTQMQGSFLTMLDPDNVIISCFVLKNILLLTCSVALCPTLDHEFHIGKFQGPLKIKRLWTWMIAALHSALHHILILDRVDEGIL
ncbi:hypothetical protein FOXYSP1_00781 [Fusarium oxysporum f. sp. phaseoli]